MTSSSIPVSNNHSRRAILAACGAAGFAGAGALAWNRFDLRSRLFNPLTASAFELPPLPGVTLAGGAAAPGFSAVDLKGAPTLLNFWASWCPPCIGEHPHLVSLAKETRIRIFGANYKDRSDSAAAFLRERGNPFAAVGQDSNGFLSRAFGARGVPWTLVLDRDARVVFTLTGPMDEAVVANQLLPAIRSVI